MATMLLGSRVRHPNVLSIAWRQHGVVSLMRNAWPCWELLGYAHQHSSRRAFARKRGPLSSIDVDFYERATTERSREDKRDTRNSSNNRISNRGTRSGQRFNDFDNKKKLRRGGSNDFDTIINLSKSQSTGRSAGRQRKRMNPKEIANRQRIRDKMIFVKTLKGTQVVDDQAEESTPRRMFRQDWIQERTNPNEKKDSGTKQQVLKGKQEPTQSRRDSLAARKKQQLENELSTHFPPFRCDVFISCLPGLEPILAMEMKELGIDCIVEAGGVTPTSQLTREQLQMCHLQLGSSSHVLLRMGKPFAARGLNELTKKVSMQPWHLFLTTKEPLPVQVRITSKKSKLNQNTPIRSAILDGINASLKAELGKRSKGVYHAQEEDEKPLRLLVRIDRDQVQLSLDTWATPSHKRGYRLETARAPLREDLAFAMVFGAGWRMYNPDNPQLNFRGMLDPFCGSGTIAIEAAAIAAGLPPGRLRPPPLHGTVWFRPKQWKQKIQKALIQASKKERERMVLQIAASDRDEGAIEAAKGNAERAGVIDWIDFQPVSISAQKWLTPKNDSEGCYPCLIATNPPWGLRLAADKKNNMKKRVHPLLPLYQTLVGRQNRLNEEGRSVVAVTLLQDPNLFRQTGADLRVMWSSKHGGIPVAAVLTGEPADNMALKTGKEADANPHTKETRKQLSAQE